MGSVIMVLYHQAMRSESLNTVNGDERPVVARRRTQDRPGLGGACGTTLILVLYTLRCLHLRRMAYVGCIRRTYCICIG
jgi:hypothetical protein